MANVILPLKIKYRCAIINPDSQVEWVIMHEQNTTLAKCTLIGEKLAALKPLI